MEKKDIEEGLVLNLDFKKRGGLLPCIVQEKSTGVILMLGYVNNEALEKTLESRLATFYSSSRKKLWTKGEESGNGLRIVEIKLDCDQDALLYMVERLGGGACHTANNDGTPRLSCFYRNIELSEVEATVAPRLNFSPPR